MSLKTRKEATRTYAIAKVQMEMFDVMAEQSRSTLIRPYHTHARLIYTEPKHHY